MKSTHLTSRLSAFTSMELIIVLAVIGILFVILILPGLARPTHRGSQAIKCASNLKQVALSFKMFASDNDGKYPFEVTNSIAYKNDSQAWLHFLSISNELGSAKILFCPSDDSVKSRAEDFSDGTNGLAFRKNSAISYFVGLDAKENQPDSWLVGDGRLGDVGHVHTGSLLFANKNSKLRWLQPLHDDRPNVALASMTNVRGSNFISGAIWPTNTNNRLLLPQ